jgi:MinD-like ATPase involved in chromosome partitioning or flagellar assembly
VGVVAVIGAKGAPGATTAAVALAVCWPRPVLLADADLGGGDIAAGWLAGRAGLDRGLLSFAAATRHAPRATAAELAAFVTAVPDAPGVLLLPGLAHAGQASALDERVWTRLVDAAAGPWPPADPADRMVRVDVVADCGRIGAGTPWPLVAAAAVVLVVTRPTLRGVHHARHALAAVQAGLGETGRVGLVVCGPGPYPAGEVGQAVGLPVRAVLPDDPRAAAALSDGTPGSRGWARTTLGRAAGAAARPLAAALAAEPVLRSGPSAAGSDASGWLPGWAIPGQLPAPGQTTARTGR